MKKAMMILLLLGFGSAFASEIHTTENHWVKSPQKLSLDKTLIENRHLPHKTLHLDETEREELLALFLLSKRPLAPK